MGKKEPKSQIFRKPIHDKATRKVAIPAQLLERSERPDGANAANAAKKEPVVDDAPETREVFAIDELSDGGLFDDLFDDEDS